MELIKAAAILLGSFGIIFAIVYWKDKRVAKKDRGKGSCCC